MAPAVIAVHTGAGSHSERYYSDYNRIAKKACIAGIKALKNGETSLEACRVAVEVLENDPLTNAGYGSNLTLHGHVENDASVMDGKTLHYGGCGAVKKLKNPVKLAYHLCKQQSKGLPLGLVPPSLLVDSGALRFAKKIGLKTVNNKTLLSEKAIRQYKKYKKIYMDFSKNEKCEDGLSLDTVGAVCIDGNGDVAAACSSGGLILKQSGRVGQGALYASGTWADSYDKSEPSVAVCTSGCGEYLVQTQFAKTIGENLKNCSCPTRTLSDTMTDKFLNSRYLQNSSCPKLCGALILRFDKDELSLMWGHSTETMSIGFMELGKKPKAFISELENRDLGKSVTVGGRFFYSEKL